MLRQVSSRNHRAKGGFKAKNALQICMLVAVCVWLLYQLKHSHDRRKAYEERFGADEARSEIASFGRKDLLLPRTVDADSVSDTRAKEDSDRDVKKDDEHPDVKDDDEHREMHTARRVEEDGKKSGVSEDQEHEEQSHEAREKSFKADDAASEVVHSNSQHVEHEEQTQEARERSFTADDASSAVDHFVPFREPESGIGLFDSSKGTQSSVVLRDDNSTLPDVNKVTTSTIPDSGDGMEEQTELETADRRLFNETKPQANGLDDRIELELGSIDSSKNQTDVFQKNHTADRTETPTKNQTTMGVTALQLPTNSHPLQQDQLPWKNKSKTENAVVVVGDQPHQNAQSEETEGSSTRGGKKQVLPREPRGDSNLHGIASVEERDGRHDPTSSEKIQHKVAEEAVE